MLLIGSMVSIIENKSILTFTAAPTALLGINEKKIPLNHYALS